MDSQTQPINGANFQQEMLSGISSSHNFILKEFTLDAIWEHPKEANAAYGNRISLNLMAINFSLTAAQYRSLLEIQDRKKRFDVRRFYAPCLRPDDTSESPAALQNWWGFTHRAAYKKLHPIAFTVRHALIFLKNRSAELPNLKTILLKPNPKKDPVTLNKIKSKYVDEIFILFRAYAKFATERDLLRD
jgi:hypothetical protein